jgi:hypothetical protein
MPLCVYTLCSHIDVYVLTATGEKYSIMHILWFHIYIYIYIYENINAYIHFFICLLFYLSKFITVHHLLVRKDCRTIFYCIFSPFYNNNYPLHILDAEDYCSTESTKHFSPYFTPRACTIKLFTAVI